MYQKELFKELMYQFVSGDISIEGKYQLFEMIDDAQYADDLDLFLRDVYYGLEPSQASEQSTERFIKNLRGKMNTLIEAEEQKTESSFFNWKKIAVAASIIMVMGIGLLFFIQKNNQSQVVQAPAPKLIEDKEPAKNGAILTLADGSKIVLDSIGNGLLTNQNNTSVSKKNGSLVYQSGDNAKTVYNTITTPRGRQFNLELSDGTRVWLNSSSSITYPTSFTAKDRKVTLTGEAYFEVAKDKARPFKVSVRDMQVNVLGTHFNVKAYEDEATIKTTLLEGSVLLAGNGKKLLLKPGQQGKQKKSGDMVICESVNLEEVMSWKNGVFYFENASLETVLRQLSRWYDVDVVFEKGVPARIFEGEIQRNLKLTQVLTILEKNKIHFKIEGKILTVMP